MLKEMGLEPYARKEGGGAKGVMMPEDRVQVFLKIANEKSSMEQICEDEDEETGRL